MAVLTQRSRRPWVDARKWLMGYRLIQLKSRPELVRALKCFAAGEMSHFGILVQPELLNIRAESNKEKN